MQCCKDCPLAQLGPTSGQMQTRTNCVMPVLGDYWNRESIATTYIPTSKDSNGCGSQCGIAERIDQESLLRANGSFLPLLKGQCDDLRSLDIGCWNMRPLVHEWQQDTDANGIDFKEFTRVNMANIKRDIPSDDSIAYRQNFRCRVNPNPSAYARAAGPFDVMEHTSHPLV
jgi:hypothetical protein